MQQTTEAETSPTRLYTVQEAATKLRVAAKWLYERTRINAIPYRRFGKYVRFSESDLEAIIESAQVPVATAITDNCYNTSNGESHKELPKRSHAASPNRSRPAQKVQAKMPGARHDYGQADRTPD